MEKIRYEIDPFNRLISRATGKASSLPYFRRVLDGRFKTDKNNNIIYDVKSPQAGNENIPHQVKLKGKFSLNDNHDLVLTLDKWGRQTLGDQLILKGEITDASANSILFVVTTTSKDKVSSTYALELSGAWQADENNRLVFKINKQASRTDDIIFTGAWEINKNYQIIYTYQKSGLKEKETHTLTFKGYWNISENAKISYVLDEDLASGFDFMINAAVFKEDSIRFEAGIGASAVDKPIIRQINLYGAWKIKEGTVEFKLNTRGVSLKLSRDLIKSDGEAFLKVLKENKEIVVVAGIGLRW